MASAMQSRPMRGLAEQQKDCELTDGPPAVAICPGRQCHCAGICQPIGMSRDDLSHVWEQYGEHGFCYVILSRE